MKALKTNIIAHLEAKGNYSPDVDDYLVDELIINIDLANECLKTIKQEGIVQTYEYKPGNHISRLNPSVNAYQMFQRNIQQLSSKLGISRNDRIKLKLIQLKEQDEFDKDFINER